MLWIRYSDKDNEAVCEAHECLGSVVRLGPSELSVNCVDDGIRTIYQKPTFEKTNFYSVFERFGIDTMFSTLRSAAPREKRKRIVNVYAKSYLQSSPELRNIIRTLLRGRLLPRLQSLARYVASDDIMAIFQAASVDAITAYFWGLSCGTNFVIDQSAHAEWRRSFFGRLALDSMFWLQELPVFTAWMQRLRLWIVPESRRICSAEIEAWCLTKCDAAEALLGNDFPPAENPVVYSRLKNAVIDQGYTDAKQIQLSCFEPEDSARNMRSSAQLEVAAELLDSLEATHEGLGNALVYMCWELSRKPSTMQHLRDELRRALPLLDMARDVSHDLPDPKSIDELPLLHAVVMETLRLYPPVPGPEPRYTPAQGTVKLGPFHGIPPGVRVQAYTEALHRNEEVFPDPLGWHPERWLSGQEGEKWQGNGQKERWFWAFSSGTRMCIGQNFAMYVLKYIIAAIYANFETYIVDDRGIEQRNGFLAGPKSGRLIVGFREVQW